MPINLRLLTFLNVFQPWKQTKPHFIFSFLSLSNQTGKMGNRLHSEQATIPSPTGKLQELLPVCSHPPFASFSSFFTALSLSLSLSLSLVCYFLRSDTSLLFFSYTIHPQRPQPHFRHQSVPLKSVFSGSVELCKRSEAKAHMTHR